MLFSDPIMQALHLHVEDAWTRSTPRPHGGTWTQPQGLRLHIRGGEEGSWNIVVYRDTWALPLRVPKSHTVEAGAGILPLVQDIRRWIDSLDLVMGERIAQTLAAWLVQEGRTKAQKIWMTSHLILVGKRSSDGRRLEWSPVPKIVFQALEPDLQVFWQLDPTPKSQDTDVFPKKSLDTKTSPRDFTLTLPESMHARMALMEGLAPGIRDALIAMTIASSRKHGT